MWYDNLPNEQLTVWSESFLTAPDTELALAKMTIMEQYALMMLQAKGHQTSFSAVAIERAAIATYNAEIAKAPQARTVGIFLEELLTQAGGNHVIVIDLFNFITSIHPQDEIMSKIQRNNSEAAFYAMLESILGHFLSLDIQLPEFVQIALADWKTLQETQTNVQAPAPVIDEATQQAAMAMLIAAMQQMSVQQQQPPVVVSPTPAQTVVTPPPPQAQQQTTTPVPAVATTTQVQRTNRFTVLSATLDNVIAAKPEALRDIATGIVNELKTDYIINNDPTLAALVNNSIREIRALRDANVGAEAAIIATGARTIVNNFFNEVLKARYADIADLFDAAEVVTAAPTVMPNVERTTTANTQDSLLFRILSAPQQPQTVQPATVANTDFSLTAVVADPMGTVTRAKANPAAAARALRDVIARIQQPAPANAVQAVPFYPEEILLTLTVSGLEAAIEKAKDVILEEQRIQFGVNLDQMRLHRFIRAVPHLEKAAVKLERKAAEAARTISAASVVAAPVAPMTPLRDAQQAQQQQQADATNGTVDWVTVRRDAEAARARRQRPNPNNTGS